jgi:hypothetical protein
MKVFCHIEAPHVHVAAPYEKTHFRVYDDRYYFVGDPTPYGWEGPRHRYHGHHPIQVEVIVGHPGIEYCYLDGPHAHFFAPAPGARFEVRSGTYWYAGRLPKRYRRERTVYVPTFTAEVHVAHPRPHLPVIIAPAPHLPHLRPHVVVEHRHERGRKRGHKKHRVRY